MFYKANGIQKAILLFTVPTNAITYALTWYYLFFKGIFTESSYFTQFFISHFGVSGLIISFIVCSGIIFLPTWLMWVHFSSKEKPSLFDKIYLSIFVWFALLIFILTAFDLANDIVVIIFRKDILLQFLKINQSGIILAIIAGFLTLPIILFGHSNYFRTDSPDMDRKKIAKSYSSISGILAGFSIVFIIFLLSSKPLNILHPLIQLVLAFFTIAAFLFIKSSERYSMAIGYQVEEEKEKSIFNFASDLYNIGIIFLLTGLLVIFIFYRLYLPLGISVIILLIELFLVLRTWA